MALSTRTRFEVLKRDGFACVYCGRDTADGVKLHVDHVVPRAQGGRDRMDNLVTACQDCNLGKAARPLSGWTPHIVIDCCLCGQPLTITFRQHAISRIWWHDHCLELHDTGQMCLGCLCPLPPGTWTCKSCAAESEAALAGLGL